MSVEHTSLQHTQTLDTDNAQGVYGALFAKINLSPVAQLGGIEIFQNPESLSEASADGRAIRQG